MIRRHLHRLLLALAATIGLPAGAATDDRSNTPPDALDGPALVRALRAGGHVIYWRHGRTDLATTDRDRRDLSRCDLQRQLSEQGRRELRAIGDTVRALGIPIGAVLSSPYCRALETARLLFGRVEPAADLTNTIDADAATAQRRAAALNRMLAVVPAAGTNAVLAGHTGNLQEASGLWPAPEGVALVFRPDGAGRYSFVARIAPERWAELARTAPRTPPR